MLLVCGDFQAVRNMRDLQCVAMPEKYRKLGGFAKYYAGQARAPVLTLVIGGNHEAANYFWALTSQIVTPVFHGTAVQPRGYETANSTLTHQESGIRRR